MFIYLIKLIFKDFLQPFFLTKKDTSSINKTKANYEYVFSESFHRLLITKNKKKTIVVS